MKVAIKIYWVLWSAFGYATALSTLIAYQNVGTTWDRFAMGWTVGSFAVLGVAALWKALTY